MKNIIKKNIGHTTIELILAMTITVSLSGLIFSAYLTIFKGFKLYTQRADNAMNAILLKKSLDKLFEEIHTVKSTYKHSFTFYTESKDKENHLKHQNNTFFLNNKSIIKNVRYFSYYISDKETKSGKRLLYWEILLKNGQWLGGAKEIR